MDKRLKRIEILREKVEEKATRQKFLASCPSIKEFEIMSGENISSLVEFLIDDTPNPIKTVSQLDIEQVISEIKGFEHELEYLLSSKIIIWYQHEVWDFGIQLKLKDFMLYTREVLNFIGYDDFQRGLLSSSLIVLGAYMRSAFCILKNEYNVEIVTWKEH